VWDEIYSSHASHCQSLWLFSILHSVPYEALFWSCTPPSDRWMGDCQRKQVVAGRLMIRHHAFVSYVAVNIHVHAKYVERHSCALKTLERNLGKNFEQCFVTLAAILGLTLYIGYDFKKLGKWQKKLWKSISQR